MRVPLSWLADYVPLTLPPEALAARLTMAGVETTYEPGASATWDKVRVGRVIDVAPHPNADRLRLATVDLGGETATVVCGAPNVAPGQRIAFASVGANLIDGKDRRAQRAEGGDDSRRRLRGDGLLRQGAGPR